MDKQEAKNQKKELTIDFDLYVKENKENFQKGIIQGYSYAMKALTVYLNKKCHIRDFLVGEYSSDWQHVLKALGREAEWNEFVEERKKQEEEKCKTPQ